MKSAKAAGKAATAVDMGYGVGGAAIGGWDWS